jgi:hypothetical protein
VVTWLNVPAFDPTQAFGGEVYNPKTKTWSPKTGVKPSRFDGETYDAARDEKRLTKQLGRVYAVVRSGDWHTLAEIAERTGDPEGSISARLRDLRKSRFGSHDIRKRRTGNTYAYTCRGVQTPEGKLF